LDVRGGRIYLHGKAATGETIERAMHDTMGVPPLRSYQLIAATDWVQRIAMRKVKDKSVEKLLRSPRALATAVLLGVNRPSYVVPALEHAVERVGIDSEENLLAEFRRRAIARYPERQREQRAMRLLTSDAGW
jgi:hypothetical protein